MREELKRGYNGNYSDILVDILLDEKIDYSLFYNILKSVLEDSINALATCRETSDVVQRLIVSSKVRNFLPGSHYQAARSCAS